MRTCGLPCLVALLVFLVPNATATPAETVVVDETETVRLWSRVASRSRTGCGTPAHGYLGVNGCFVGASFAFESGETASFVFNAATIQQPEYSCLVENLTNGENDLLKICAGIGLWYSCEPKLEGQWHLGLPDRQGYLIDSIVLQVERMYCGPNHSFLDLRWEFWGQEDVGQPVAAIAPSTLEIFPHEPVSLVVVLDRAEVATVEPGFGIIDPAGGELEILVPQEVTYVLTATNAVGTERRELTLTPKLPVVQLDAEPREVYPGDRTTVSWSVVGATDVALEPDVASGLPGQGSMMVTPDSDGATYTLVACNALGCVEQSVTIDWLAPSVRLLSVPPFPFVGDPIDLRIYVAGAESATLEPGFGPIEPVDQVLQVVIEEPTTFVLSATNAHGTSTNTLKVQHRTPRLGLSAVPLDPRPGEEVVIEVSIAGATHASLDPLLGPIPPEDATYSMVVDEPVTVSLSATNSVGTTTREMTIVPWPLVRFSVDPPFVMPGQKAELSWEVLPFADVAIESLGPQPPRGSHTIEVDRSMTFALYATHDAVDESAKVDVFLGSENLTALELHFSEERLLPTDPKLEPGTPFDLYLLAVRPDKGVAGYEFRLHYSDCLVPQGRMALQDGALDVGSGEDNWIVGLPSCEVDPLFTPLVRYTFVAPDEACLDAAVVSIGPSQPSSFSPPAPGYLTCGHERELRTFEPFYVQPSLALATIGESVPALGLRVTAMPTASGVQLSWGALGTAPDRVMVLRSTRRGTTEFGAMSELLRLEGEYARSSRGWLDASVEKSTTYRYQVVARAAGMDVVSETIEVTTGVRGVGVTRLLANVPNPFNPLTEIRYQLSTPSEVRIAIFDASGRRVRSERWPRQPVGVHAWTWDGTGSDGSSVGSGVYYVRLETDGTVDTRRIALLR